MTPESTAIMARGRIKQVPSKLSLKRRENEIKMT